MDEVITRIVAIERQCSADVEQVRQEYAKNIESRKQSLEDQKTRAFAQITAEEKLRLTKAMEEAKRQIEQASLAFQRDCEIPFQNQVLAQTIQEEIISILFEG